MQLKHLIFKYYDPYSNQIGTNIGEKWNKIFKELWTEKNKELNQFHPKKLDWVLLKNLRKEYVWVNDVQHLIDSLLVIHGEDKAENDSFLLLSCLVDPYVSYGA